RRDASRARHVERLHPRAGRVHGQRVVDALALQGRRDRLHQRAAAQVEREDLAGRRAIVDDAHLRLAAQALEDLGQGRVAGLDVDRLAGDVDLDVGEAGTGSGQAGGGEEGGGGPRVV